MPLNDSLLLDHAAALARLLPELMGRLSVLDDGVAANLPLGQLRVCVLLRSGPRWMSALSRDLGVSLSAMTQIADRLEQAGLVRRVAGKSDRRAKRLRLTGRGEKLMRTREENRVRRLVEVLAGLPSESRHEVRQAVETLLGACTSLQERVGADGLTRRHT